MEIYDALRRAELRYADLVEEARRHNLAAKCTKPPATPSLFSRILTALKTRSSEQPKPAARPTPNAINQMHKPVH